LSRSLTQLHKGALDLKETENNMNVFFITMPVHQDEGPDIFAERKTSITVIKNT
jgi:hypothetical protein